jgi:hypothetical protein
MLLGGKGGCQQCTCVPCDACTRTCTNPHTGDAFEAVYTRYFEGAEDGNVSDGYLTASGDSDTSDPYDGMDGNGPWFQQVAGEFTLDPSTTRHPCGVTVSFWRNNYVLGASTIPPPATTTTMNRIRVSVSALSETGVLVEGTYVAIGDTLDLNVTIPLVTGGGDQSTNDPPTYSGSATVSPECHNKTAIFTVQARLEWDVKKRQHVVYGLVRECYEEGTPCATFCSGVAPPNVAYLTISNYTGPTYDSPTPMDIEGTYVLERAPGFCNYYYTYWNSNLCFSLVNPLGATLWAPIAINSYGTENHGFYMGHYVQIGGVCGGFELFPPDAQFSICGSGVLFSGTNGRVRVNGGTIIENAFDWEIEA